MFPDIDHQALAKYTSDLEALGFVQAYDFEVKLDVIVAGCGFARLFIHPVHHCLAEVNQIFPQDMPTPPMRCMIASILSDEWDLSTTDREMTSLSYAWRRPRNLWSSYPKMTPAELLAAHLARRQQMMDRLHITVNTDLSPKVILPMSNKFTRRDEPYCKSRPWPPSRLTWKNTKWRRVKNGSAIFARRKQPS